MALIDPQEALVKQRSPVSAAQHGIWLGQQLDITSPAYWTAEVIQLQGALDEGRFASAVRDTLLNCEALHARFFHEDTQLSQEILPFAQRVAVWRFPCLDLSKLGQSEAQASQRAWQWMADDVAAYADLARGPLFASALLKIAEGHFLWYLRVHHIAVDGYAYSLLTQEVAQRYRGEWNLPQAQKSSKTFFDVLQEEQHYQASPAWQRDAQFWHNYLPAEALAKELPQLADAMPLSAEVRRLRGPALPFDGWQKLATQYAVDSSCLLLAACAAWLSRESGLQQICLGLPVMNRLGSSALRVPCLNMNIVPLRLTVQASDSLLSLASQVRAELARIRPHQRYRYEQMKSDLGLLEGRKRLFGPVINLLPFQTAPQFSSTTHEIRASHHALAAGPVADLALNLAFNLRGQDDDESYLRVDFEANPLAYSAARLAQLADHCCALIDALRLQPELPFGAMAQWPQQVALAYQAADTFDANDFARCDVLERICAVAQRTPDALALQQDEQCYSYAQLLAAVQQCAAQLQRAGVASEQRILLLLPRQPETIIAMLAVLWLGAAYVPLAPDSPPLRLAAIVEDVQANLALCLPQDREKLPSDLPVLHLLSSEISTHPVSRFPANAQHLAYIMYTSGTTGKPNGVMIERGALAQFVQAASRRYQVSSHDRFLQFAPLHFDASVEEIYLPLSAGASLALRTDAMLESIPSLLAACRALQISFLDLPTAFWHELALYVSSHADARDLAAWPATLRVVIIGGEAASLERLKRWQASVPKQVLLHNTYGPTEATVVCSSAPFDGDSDLTSIGDAVPIGQALAGTGFAVCEFDAAGHAHILPVGASGELLLMGASLARGYWQRASLTAQRFISLVLPANADNADQAPSAPQRAYRTGDCVRMSATGQLHYLGRLDDEIKISGQRIDIREIEEVLLAQPDVQEAAVVVVNQDSPADGSNGSNGMDGASLQLHAYIAVPWSPESQHSQLALLRAALAQRLPASALPNQIHCRTALPKNSNGKLDKQLLKRELKEAVGRTTRSPSPAHLNAQLGEQMREQSRQTAAFACPRTSRILQTCRTMLGQAQLELDDDLFAFGAKSLQAIQLANRLSIETGSEVPVASIFRFPSVRRLAEHLAATPVAASAQGNPYAPVLAIARGTRASLICVHPAEGLAWCYLGLARHLPDVQIVGLQAEGMLGAQASSIAEQLQCYLAALKQAQPQGPYHLLGWSSGGGIAQALAGMLQAQGDEVALLAMMDAYPSDFWQGKAVATRRDALLALLDNVQANNADQLAQLDEAALSALLRKPGRQFAQEQPEFIERLLRCALQNMSLYREIAHPQFLGEVVFFRAQWPDGTGPDWRAWQAYCPQMGPVLEVQSSHHGMGAALPLAHIGRVLAQRLGVRTAGVHQAV